MISYELRNKRCCIIFRSKGDAKALFLRHEGFLGALGAFMNYEKNGFTDITHQFMDQSSAVAEGLVCKDEDF